MENNTKPTAYNHLPHPNPVIPGAPLTYRIVINEYQRRALLALVKLHPELTSGDQELTFFPEMLELIVEQETQFPRGDHAFCV